MWEAAAGNGPEQRSLATARRVADIFHRHYVEDPLDDGWTRAKRDRMDVTFKLASWVEDDPKA